MYIKKKNDQYKGLKTKTFTGGICIQFVSYNSKTMDKTILSGANSVIYILN